MRSNLFFFIQSTRWDGNKCRLFQLSFNRFSITIYLPLTFPLNSHLALVLWQYFPVRYIYVWDMRDVKVSSSCKKMFTEYKLKWIPTQAKNFNVLSNSMGKITCLTSLNDFKNNVSDSRMQTVDIRWISQTCLNSPNKKNLCCFCFSFI